MSAHPDVTKTSSRRFRLPTLSDIVAGLITGLFSIPEGMAYAQMGGFNPILGLYAGMFPVIAAGFTTGSVFMVSTLTSAIALSSQSAIQQAGLPTSNISAVITLTALVGGIIFLLGLFRAGAIINFVSNAVMTGFVVGVAVSILVGELGNFSGYEPEGGNKVVKIVDWFLHIPQWKFAEISVGIATILLMLLLQRVKRIERLATIIVLIIVTLGVFIFRIPVALVQNIATISGGLPGLALPDPALIPSLLPGALAISLVALAQGASISASIPNPDGRRADVSRDFLGQGVGNLVGALFQALPTGGSLSRTGILVGGGAASRWAVLFSGLWLMLIVLLFGALAGLIPLALIGGLLFMIAGELILGRVSDIQLVMRTSPLSTLAMVVTFLMTLFLGLQWAILLGAVLSILLYLGKTAGKARLVSLEQNEQGRWEERNVPAALSSEHPTVVQLINHGFFAEVPAIERLLPASQDVHQTVVLLSMRGTYDVPSTLLKALMGYSRDLKKQGNRLMLIGIEPPVMTVLKQSGGIKAFGEENLFPASRVVAGALDEAYAMAESWMVEQRSQKGGK